MVCFKPSDNTCLLIHGSQTLSKLRRKPDQTKQAELATNIHTKQHCKFDSELTHVCNDYAPLLSWFEQCMCQQGLYWQWECYWYKSRPLGTLTQRNENNLQQKKNKVCDNITWELQCPPTSSFCRLVPYTSDWRPHVEGDLIVCSHSTVVARYRDKMRIKLTAITSYHGSQGSHM